MTYTQLIKHYGSVTLAARALAYSRTIIYEWRDSGIPYRTQRVIEFETKGQLKARKK